MIAALFVRAFRAVAKGDHQRVRLRRHAQRLAEFRSLNGGGEVAPHLLEGGGFERFTVERHAQRRRLLVELRDERVDIGGIPCDVAEGVDAAARDLLHEFEDGEVCGGVCEPCAVIQPEHAEGILQGAGPEVVSRAENAADRCQNAQQKGKRHGKDASQKGAGRIVRAGEDLSLLDKFLFQRDLAGVGRPERLAAFAHALSLPVRTRKSPAP